MPFQFDQQATCPNCPHGFCIKDRRTNPIPGRKTQFRFHQHEAVACCFESFVPGTDNDPDPNRSFVTYLNQFGENAEKAGQILFGADCDIGKQAIAKVTGDIFELIGAATLWNAASVWNRFMDTGVWKSNSFVCPKDSVAAPGRKVAIVPLPRGYDATLLFREDARKSIAAHEHALKQAEMELGLSAPDIVGVRIPEPCPKEFKQFLQPLPNLGDSSRQRIENAYQSIEGKLDGRSFLFAIAMKRSIRSDRLYQPLFEANILKYLISEVLRGSALRFFAHFGDIEGANAEDHYRAATIVSLMRGGKFERAIDKLYVAVKPRDTAQEILQHLPSYAL
ncbi:MAG: Cfr10I/Bse634I family restriction endonuclease [Verrucomicrobia bacterium]|nr:Cfr10I/Bse634I family restriction endonuclease [Verrucomicrobiota bacterium]